MTTTNIVQYTLNTDIAERLRKAKSLTGMDSIDRIDRIEHNHFSSVAQLCLTL